MSSASAPENVGVEFELDRKVFPFSVDALLRKQTALERDMSAIHQKLIAHDKDAQNILAKVYFRELLDHSTDYLALNFYCLEATAQAYHPRLTEEARRELEGIEPGG